MEKRTKKWSWSRKLSPPRRRSVENGGDLEKRRYKKIRRERERNGEETENLSHLFFLPSLLFLPSSFPYSSRWSIYNFIQKRKEKVRNRKGRVREKNSPLPSLPPPFLPLSPPFSPFLPLSPPFFPPNRTYRPESNLDISSGGGAGGGGASGGVLGVLRKRPKSVKAEVWFLSLSLSLFPHHSTPTETQLHQSRRRDGRRNRNNF